jgi:hypothetical protein
MSVNISGFVLITGILAIPTPIYPGLAPGATVTTPPAAPGQTVITW